MKKLIKRLKNNDILGFGMFLLAMIIGFVFYCIYGDGVFLFGFSSVLLSLILLFVLYFIYGDNVK